ncbi:MAG: hypothetical protein QF639_01435 [Rhodospirillales bacterium]|jgi:hypothetical protein|nr:hypothetical protein [Rhodospirillales bacterium]HJO71757.1 hypothetical protein [Rhodospirillales bacterium]
MANSWSAVITLNIGHKIGSIAVVLMVAGAVFSYNLVGNVSDELRSITATRFPVIEAVSRIAVHALEHGTVLQRAIVLYGEEARDDAAIGRLHQRLEEFRRKIVGEFARARGYLSERRSPAAGTGVGLDRLGGHITAILGGMAIFAHAEERE